LEKLEAWIVELPELVLTKVIIISRRPKYISRAYDVESILAICD